MGLAVVILAAGQGTRMKSALPKVLHQICGRPMIGHVLLAVRKLGVEKTIAVVGHQKDLVVKAIGTNAEIVLQAEQKGTAHALLQCRKALYGYAGEILVVCGDTPLLRSSTLQELAAVHRQSGAAATVLTADLADPTGYGRIIRNAQGNIMKIVEQKDAGPDELAVHEINTGVYCFKAAGLFEALSKISADNAQGEFYLTDIIEYYTALDEPVEAVTAAEPLETEGVNNRLQLFEAEKTLRRRVAEKLMLSGVTIMDPASTFIDDTVLIGKDTVIYPFTIIEGKSKIGENCSIGPSTRLVSVCLGNMTRVQNSVVIESRIGEACEIGPFAYIRPGCDLERAVKVGDFVELKNSSLGEGSKAPHLSYVGDTSVGRGANIGAGTITCNYDGFRKSRTIIGDHAFIGSNSNLVAPVNIGAGAVTGAGSTITKDVPSGSLGITREKQKIIPNWTEKRRTKIEE